VQERKYQKTHSYRDTNVLLTEKQAKVVQLVHDGLKNVEVAREIGTTELVVKNYLRVLYDEIGVWNRVELALWYEAHA